MPAHGSPPEGRGQLLRVHLMARPSKLTPELQDEFVAAIRGGAWFTDACRQAGVNKSTAYEWLRRARGDDARPALPDHVSFADAVDAAFAAQARPRHSQAASTKSRRARDPLRLLRKEEIRFYVCLPLAGARTSPRRPALVFRPAASRVFRRRELA